MRKLFYTIIFSVILLAPVLTLAVSNIDNAGTILGQVGKPTGLEEDLPTTASTVVKALLALVGTVFFALTIYAGIRWMTAQGNDEKVTKAKDTLEAALIGMAIVFLAYAITAFVTGRLSGGGGGGGGGDKVGAPNEPGLSDSECNLQGGQCFNNPDDPCDADGIGDDDPYEGTPLGTCENNNSTCCLLKDSAGNGTLKCTNMGGRCHQDNCPPGDIDLGDCDAPGIDITNNCCKT